jgi:hypothetical protein
MFTAAEIADLHSTYNEALVDTCVILRDGVTVDTVACAVMRPRKWSVPGAGGQDLGKDVDFTVSVPLGTDARTNDEITVTGKNLRLRVGELVEPGTTYDHALFLETTVEV